MANEPLQTGTDTTDLNNLAARSKRLNAATDELNRTLESIQQKLNDLAMEVRRRFSTALATRLRQWFLRTAPTTRTCALFGITSWGTVGWWIVGLCSSEPPITSSSATGTVTGILPTI